MLRHCCSGFAAGIYTTNSAEACEYVVSNCKANIVVVENDVQMQKILKVKANLPHLKAIIQYTGEIKDKLEITYTVSCEGERQCRIATLDHPYLSLRSGSSSWRWARRRTTLWLRSV